MRKLILIIILLVTTVNGFSQNIIDSLTQITLTSKSDSTRAEAFYYLTFQYINNDIALAKKTNNQSFSLAKKLNSNYAFARAHNAKGVIHDVEGNVDSALIQYKISLNFAEKSGSLLTKASIINNIGLLDWNKGNFDAAIKNYNESLKLFEQINNINGIANSQSNIGLIYYDVENYKKAEEYTLKSMETRQKTKDDYGISVSLVNMARIYDKQMRFQDAVNALEKSKEIKIKIKDDRGLSTVYNNLTSIYLKIKNFYKAIEYGKKSLEYSQRVSSKLNMIYSLGALSDIYLLKKDYSNALQFIEKGIILADETDNKPALQDFFIRSENIYRNLGDYKKAYYFLNKKDSINKLLFDLEKEKIISETEEKYQSEKKEKEIALQKATILKNELVIKNNRLVITLMIVGLIALVGLLFGYYKRQSFINSQIKKELELKTELQKIETENELHTERLRISRDLHDNIGSQLTFITSSLDNFNYKFKEKGEVNVEKIDEISQFTKNTIFELRDTIWALNQNEISIDNFDIRIQSFIEKARAAHPDVIIEFTSKDKETLMLNSLKGINVLRFLQEAINNALKHAKASKISINTFAKNNQLHICISDDGVGFDLNEISQGFGLDNMQKRIADSGGTLQIISSKGKGTEIKAII